MSSAVPMYTYQGRRFHSQHNPEQEASRQWEVFLKGQPSLPELLVIFHPGLNYLGKFIRSIQPGIVIVSVFLDRLSWERRVWDSDFDMLCDGPGFEAFFSWLEDRASLVLFKNPAFLFHPVFVSLASQAANNAQARLAALLQRVKIEILSQGYFSYLLPGLIQRNIQLLEKSQISSLPLRIPQAEDRTPAIAASGFSLLRYQNFLQEERDKLYVIALPSSIAALEAMGIEPDLIVTIDSGYWAQVHLRTIPRLWKTRVAASLKANLPLSDPLFKQRLWLFTTGSPTELLALANRKHSLPYFPERGTVAASALDIAGCMSQRHAIVLGQDLASTHYLSHLHPHSLDFYHSIRSGRFSTFEQAKISGAMNAGHASSGTLAEEGILSSASLDYYRDWFTRNAATRFPFALSPHSSYPWNGMEMLDNPSQVFSRALRPKLELQHSAGFAAQRVQQLLQAFEAFCSNPAAWGVREDFDADLDGLFRECKYFAYKAAASGRSKDLSELEAFFSKIYPPAGADL